MINPDEELLVVDKFDSPLGVGRRSELLGGKAWVRTSSVFIVCNKQILCHQRAAGVDSYPSVWTMPFGGHAAPGESPAQTAVKELKEEAGIDQDTSKLEVIMLYPDKLNRKMKWLFSHVVKSKEINFELEAQEVAAVQWIKIEKLQKIYSQRNKNWTQQGYEKLALELLSPTR